MRSLHTFYPFFQHATCNIQLPHPNKRSLRLHKKTEVGICASDRVTERECDFGMRRLIENIIQLEPKDAFFINNQQSDLKSLNWFHH